MKEAAGSRKVRGATSKAARRFRAWFGVFSKAAGQWSSCAEVSESEHMQEMSSFETSVQRPGSDITHTKSVRCLHNYLPKAHRKCDVLPPMCFKIPYVMPLLYGAIRIRAP